MTAFHLSTATQFLLFVFALRKGPKTEIVWFAICCGAALSLLMETAYYSPWVSAQAYRWTYEIVDALATALDLSVLCVLLFSLTRCCAAHLAGIVTICWHQIVKLNWHWSAELFSAPSKPNAWLTALRAWSSWLVLGAFAWISYCEGRQHDQTTKETCRDVARGVRH